MSSNGKAFSEGKDVLGDGVFNAHGVDRTEIDDTVGVDDHVVPGGVLLMSDCLYCGRQWKGIAKWPEVIGFFLGEIVPNTKSTQQGVVMAFGCRVCSRVSPLRVSWEEVRRYIDSGVQRGLVRPDIYRAAEERAKHRAEEMAKRRAAGLR